MSRPITPITYKETDLNDLHSLAHGGNINPKIARRARIVLMGVEGHGIEETAKALQVAKNTVILWRRRFSAMGLAGLYDVDRPGRRGQARAEAGKALDKAVMGMRNHVPEGLSVQKLAEDHNTSETMVTKALQRAGITLMQQRTWAVPAATNVEPRTLELTGMFIGASACALVFSESVSSEDENHVQGAVRTFRKPTAEALIRQSQKNPPLTMLDALQTLNERADQPKVGKPTELSSFLKRLVNRLPSASKTEYSVIFCSCRPITLVSTDKVRLHLYSVPTFEDWINQAQMMLDLLCRRDADGLVVRSFKDLAHCFVKRADENTEPFMWGMAVGSSPEQEPLTEDNSETYVKMTAQLVSAAGEPRGPCTEVVRPFDGINHIDRSTKEGFLKSFHQVESETIDARDRLCKEFVETTLNADGAKKN